MLYFTGHICFLKYLSNQHCLILLKVLIVAVFQSGYQLSCSTHSNVNNTIIMTTAKTNVT